MSEQRTKAPGKKGWIIAVVGVAAVLAAALVILFTQMILPGNRYKGAEELAAQGDGYAAALASEHLGDSKDAQPRKMEFLNPQSVAAGDWYTVGLRSDGTVVATGNNDYGQCDVSDWTDIVAVAAGWAHTVGLRSDGTVVAVGYNSLGKCDVSDWTDIVAVAAGDDHTVGLRSDGTVVAVGDNDYGQCDVSDWTDIRTPD